MTTFSIDGLPRWQLDIINKYPSLYLIPSPGVRQWYIDAKIEHTLNEKISNGTYCNLRYGFEFREGWKNLADKFSQELVELVTFTKTIQPDAWAHACIYKEKFGRLEWQGDTNFVLPKPIYDLEGKYMAKSQTVCEVSGTPGTLRNINGYLCVLSESEYLKEKERRSNG